MLAPHVEGLAATSDPCFGRWRYLLRYGACIGGSLGVGPSDVNATNSERSQDELSKSASKELLAKNSLKGLAHETRISGTHPCRRRRSRSSACERTNAEG